ncbi:MAG: HNH endonuclease signature motif containing protein, partial [Euzebya sp.]
AAHCDVHHVIPREQGGPTDITNTALICRPDHTPLTRGRWRMRMDPDGTLYTTIGRHTYTTRPRLNAPPPLGRPPPGRPPPPAMPPGDPSAKAGLPL